MGINEQRIARQMRQDADTLHSLGERVPEIATEHYGNALVEAEKLDDGAQRPLTHEKDVWFERHHSQAMRREMIEAENIEGLR